jgi:hypothetical protein
MNEARASSAASAYEKILRAHVGAGLPFTGGIGDFNFDLNRGPLTPTEAFLFGQGPAPAPTVVEQRFFLQLENGIATEIYLSGREGAESVGLG